MKRVYIFFLAGFLLSCATIVRADFAIVHKGSSDKLIIFVHGLWGDLKSTFSASQNARSWPEMMAFDTRPMRAGPPLSEYTTAVLGYPAGRADTLSLEQIANRLTTDLYDSEVFDHYNEIFFVCHSLGGLVLKKLFVNLNIEHSIDVSKVAAIFLISTPSQGAPAANFVVNVLPQVISGRLILDIQTIDVNTYLQSLEAQWQAVLRNRKEQFPLVYCAYETQPTGPLTVVSQVFTATVCDETPRAENANHLNIVKPKSVDDSIYMWVRGRIAQVISLVQSRKVSCSDNYISIRVPSHFFGPFYNLERYDLIVEIANQQDRTILLNKIVAYFINSDVFSKVEVFKSIPGTDDLPTSTYFISIYENPGVLPPRGKKELNLMGPDFLPQKVHLIESHSASPGVISCNFTVSDLKDVEYPMPKSVIVPESGLGVDVVKFVGKAAKAAPPGSRLLSILPGKMITLIQNNGLFVHQVSQWMLNFIDSQHQGSVVIVDTDGIKPAGTYDAEKETPNTPAFESLINFEQVRIGQEEALRIANRANIIYGNSPNGWAMLAGWDDKKRSLPIWRLPYIGKDYLNIFISARDGTILPSIRFFNRYSPMRTVSSTRFKPHDDKPE